MLVNPSISHFSGSSCGTSRGIIVVFVLRGLIMGFSETIVPMTCNIYCGLVQFIWGVNVV
jgi:hypothetical protein